jgi:VanZ family protein
VTQRRPLSLATQLAWLAVVVIAYASLYPFDGWRGAPWNVGEWLLSPWPKYWSGFDLWANWLGYMPLGALWATAALRQSTGVWFPVWSSTAKAALLSLLLESVQGFMLHRVSSNIDWGMNTLGALCGALLARWWLFPRNVRRWDALRHTRLASEGGAEMTLVLLWLLALLVPTALPFSVGRLAPATLDGLHQMLRSWEWAPDAFQGFLWIPTPLQESLVLGLTLVTPMAVAALTVWGRWNRVLAGFVVLAGALLVPMLLAVVTHGWRNAGAWLLPTLPLGFGIAALTGVCLLLLPRRALAGVAVLLLLLHGVLVNLYATAGYWDANWQQFGQGRFVRMYGVLSWVAVSWPWLAVLVLSRRWLGVSRP